jgi:hypothetical protein
VVAAGEGGQLAPPRGSGQRRLRRWPRRPRRRPRVLERRRRLLQARRKAAADRGRVGVCVQVFNKFFFFYLFLFKNTGWLCSTT